MYTIDDNLKAEIFAKLDFWHERGFVKGNELREDYPHLSREVRRALLEDGDG